VIQLWDILKKERKPVYSGTDRVFDLVFSQNSRYLFSGRVRQWDLTRLSKKPSQIANFKFPIYALAISESLADSSLVFIAGRYNKIAVWDWNKKTIYEVTYKHELNQSKQERFQPVMGQQNYITSLATANDTLAISDNQGYVTLWNINQIRQCIAREVTQQEVDNQEKRKSIYAVQKKTNKKVANNKIQPLERISRSLRRILVALRYCPIFYL
jgi:WD40 repeat protein